MPKADRPELIAAQLARVPWWRSALLRLGARRRREHAQALERLAGRKAADAVREEDIRAWIAAIETKSREADPPGPRKSARS